MLFADARDQGGLGALVPQFSEQVIAAGTGPAAVGSPAKTLPMTGADSPAAHDLRGAGDVDRIAAGHARFSRLAEIDVEVLDLG